MTINFLGTGIPASKISTGSMRAGSAMLGVYGNLYINNIRMMGRWHSNAMMRYLRIQAQPIIIKYAAAIFNDGN
jgi:hypothetical protein